MKPNKSKLQSGYKREKVPKRVNGLTRPIFSAKPPTYVANYSTPPIMEHDHSAVNPQPLANHSEKDFTIPVIVPKVLSIITLSICLSKDLFFQEQVMGINDSNSRVKVTFSKLLPIQQNDRNIQCAKLFINGHLQLTLTYTSKGTNKEQFDHLRCVNTLIPFTCCTTITFPSSHEPIVMPTKPDDDHVELFTHQGTRCGQVHCELVAHTTDEMMVIEKDEQFQSVTHQTIVHLSISLQLKLELIQQQQIRLCKLK